MGYQKRKLRCNAIYKENAPLIWDAEKKIFNVNEALIRVNKLWMTGIDNKIKALLKEIGVFQLIYLNSKFGNLGTCL